MKYLPTLDVWNPAIHSAIISGQIKLQPGQWIRCGSDQLSRFVAVRKSGLIWAAHPDGKKGVSNRSFKNLLNAA
jgi:hypothetical protein